MRRNWKCKLAQRMNCSPEMNQRLLCIKRSWDEVECILNHGKKGKKEKKENSQSCRMK